MEMEDEEVHEEEEEEDEFRQWKEDKNGMMGWKTVKEENAGGGDLWLWEIGNE